MAVVIQVDVNEARSNVQALNQDILNIAASATTIKSAFGGTDFLSGFMESLSSASTGIRKLQEDVGNLNQTLGITNQSLKEYTDTTRNTVQSAQQASQAILGKVDSLQKEAAANNLASDSMDKLNAAEARAALTWTNQEKVLRATTTALQLKRQVTQELNDMMEQNLITERDAARYQEIMASTYRATGTAAETLLASLKQQNAEFLATQNQLLRMTDGWKTLTDTQKTALQTQQQLNNDIRLVGGYYNDAGNIMTVFTEKMQAINNLHAQGATTSAQHAQAVDNLTREFDLEISAAQKAADAMAKKSYQDSLAGQQEKKVQDAINATTNIITRGIDPVAQYAKRIADLNTALAGASTYGGGQIGISQSQYQAGLRGAREELEKNIASSIRARTEMGALNSQFNIGAQAAAGFRAGLQGAGVGFGIFTSNTIAVATAVYGMSKAIRESIAAGADFQETFTRGVAMMDGFDLKTRQVQIPIAALQAQVMGLAETTRFSSTDISKALVALGQAGYNTAEAMKALPTVLNLATVGEQTTEEATNRLINVITAFGMKAEDAASASDKLVEASLVSTTTIGELMTGLGQVGSVAHNAGLGFEEVLGALAAMRQQGVQASKAGTDLRYAIQRLSEPTAKASAVMNQLGIDTKKFFDDLGHFDLTGTLHELDRVLGSIDEKARNSALYTIFGSRASVGFTALLNTINDTTHGIDAMTAKIKDSQGATEGLASIVNNNAKVAFEQLGHTIENIAISAFQSNQDELTEKIREFSEYIRSNGPQISQTIADVTKTIVSLTEMVAKNADVLIGTFVAYEGWRTLAATTSSVLALWGKASDAYAAAVMRARAATVEDTLAVNARAAAGSTRLLPELEAEVVAFDAQAAAAGRAGAATVAAGTASTAAAGAMGVLRAAGSGIVAMLGGWPTLIAGAVIAVGVLAYKLHESMQLAETDITGTHEATIKLNSAMQDLGSLDYSGLRQFEQQLDNQTEALNKQSQAIQHNLDVLEQERLARAQMQSQAGLELNWNNIPDYTQEELDRQKQYQQNQELINNDLEVMARRKAEVEGISMFKLSDIQPYIGELNTLEDKLAAQTAGVGDYATAISLFFNRMRLENRITNEEYDKTIKYLQDMAKFAKEQAEYRNAVAMGPPAPPKVPGSSTDINGQISAAVARAKELSGELAKIVESYNKAAGAAGEWTTQLKEDNALQEALAKGTLRKELDKLGISAKEAEAALQWKVGEDVFTSLKAKLVDLNPAFKDITDGTKDLTQQSGNLADAYALVDSEVAKMIAKAPAQAAAISKMGETIKTQLGEALDGSLATIKEFNQVIANQGKNLTAAFQVDGITDLQARVEALGVSLSDSQRGAMAEAQAYQLLGGNMKTVAQNIRAVTDTSSIYSSVQSTINALLSDPNLAAYPDKLNAIVDALHRVAEATPEGKLEKQNENLRNQIDIISSGGQNLEVYNTLWQATNGHLEKATDEMKQAAVAQQALNEQFSRMQEVQNTFKSFASSLGDAFGKFFTDTKHNWSDLVGDIKSSFKKLLQDLISQAITNQILFYFGFNSQGIGGGGGSLGGIIGMAAGLMGLSGGGGGGNSFVGSLIGGAAAGNATYNGAGAPAGGTFGTVSNLVSAGQTGYQMYTGSYVAPWNYASGHALPGSGAFGTATYNTSWSVAPDGSLVPGGGYSYAPTGLGYGLAAAGGLYMGYNRYQNRYDTASGLAGGATYAIGGTALGLGIGSLAAGGSFAAGVGAMAGGASAMGASAGVAAAVPVVGWIALALMAVDMLTGGGLFGTSANKFVGGATDTTITGSGADISGHYTMKGKKPLFGGSYYEEHPMDITPEMQAQADQLYHQIHQVAVQATNQLGVELGDGITGSFEQQFDKDGNVTKSISTVLGKTYEEPMEDFVKRMQAEEIVSAVGKSIEALGGSADEANTIAEQFRADATTLLDAAQLMLQAQTDIKNGQGLLRESGAGVLTDTVNIVQALQQSGETLQQTYARLIAETQLLDQVFDSFGSTFNRQGTEFVQFADDFVQALGGLDKATAAWNEFVSAIFGSTGYVSQATSSGKIGGELEALGLSASTTVEEFAKAFRAVGDSLSPQELAQWVQAGADLGTINQSLLIMQGLADGVDLTGVLSQQAQIVASVNQWINTAAQLGASEEQLAQMRELGKQAIANQLNDFMGNIEDQIDKFEGGDWLYQLDQINRQMKQNIDTARALGASDEQLAEIQKLAAYQTAQVIAQLQESITSLVNQLHGVTDATQHSGGGSSVVDQGQQAIDQAQRDLYNAAQNAIQQITEFLNSLQTGPLSTQDWQGQLNSSQQQFEDLVARAQAGDTDAMQQLTEYAQTYLQHAQDAYGNSQTYQEIFDNVTSILANLQAQFGEIAAPPDATPGAGGGGGGSGATTVTLTEQDRYQLSLQIAQQLGALGVALDASVWDLMDSFGITVGELADNMGVHLDHIDDTFFTNLNIMANALGVSTTELLEKLGANPAEIGAFFQVTADQINAGNLTNIATMAEALGISAFQAITYMGGDLATAIKANGIDITSLDPATMIALGTIANTLGVNIVDLLTQLGVGIDKFAQPLADTIRDDLSKIPGLSDATVAGLQPLLDALGIAVNTGDLNTALGNINDYIATLPEDQATALTSLFKSLGIDLDQSENMDAQTTAQQQLVTNTGDTNTALGTLHEDIAGTGNNSLVSKLGDISSDTAYLSQILTAIQNGGGTQGAQGYQSTIPGGGYVGGDTMSAGDLMSIPGGTQTDALRGLAALPNTMESAYTAGQQIFEASVGDGSAIGRGAQASQETVQQIAEMAFQIQTLHEAVAGKLDKVNKTQSQTRDHAGKLVRQGKMSSISRSVR
jgi:TP901 family phage tail tape measure protein